MKIHKAEPLAPESGPFKVEIAIEESVIIKFQQKQSKKEVKL
jgi:hypothetical protein